MVQDEPSMTAVSRGPMPRALVVEDDENVRRIVSFFCESLGFRVSQAESAEEAIGLDASDGWDAAVLDLRLPGMDGIALLQALRRRWPRLPAVLLTGSATVESAVAAMRAGAVHVLAKPFKRADLAGVLRSAHEAWQRRGGRAEDELPPLVAESAVMKRLVAILDPLGPTTATVLIQGESGAGKELVARHLHARSPCASGPFIAVNCAALPDSLVESELFGHERGAFTGADEPRVGLFRSADGGTLLLDEIGDLPAIAQAKLLRTLEDGEVRAVGSDRAAKVSVRVIAATNSDLDGDVVAGKFRQDLFYRVARVRLYVPPLRERVEDVPVLARTRIAELNGLGADRVEIAPGAARALLRHAWPGNVRELRALLENAVLCGCRNRLELRHLRAAMTGVGRLEGGGVAGMATLAEIEQKAIDEALRRAGGDRLAAARMLGIGKSTLYRKIREYEQRKKP